MSKKDEKTTPMIVEAKSFEDMMEKLTESLPEGEPTDPLQALGDALSSIPHDDEPEEASEPVLPKFKEGDVVRVEGLDMDSNPIVLMGKMRGLAPVMGPFGIVGHDLIIEVDKPEDLPTTTGDVYPYTCITAPLDACKEPVDDKENDDG